MRLPRKTLLQLLVFTLVTLVAGGVMVFKYIQVPATMFDIGRYTVTAHLTTTGGLYGTANVTYRGSEIGKVESVSLSDTGVNAVMSLRSGQSVPSSVRAEVHSRSAIGEQYVELVPTEDGSAPLRDGDVISADRTSVPTDIGTLIDTVQKSLAAIPRENLTTVIDESYNALGGTGPQLSRLLDGASSLTAQARENVGPLTTLVDQVGPVLDSQATTSGAIADWASHLADVTGQLRATDGNVRSVLQRGADAADQVTALMNQVKPTLPVLLANLVSLGQVAVTYQKDLEQLLVLLPQGTAAQGTTAVPNLGTNSPYRGGYLSFNLNLNLPPPCTTGYLPADQRRSPVETDYPERPAGDIYCRVPQDSQNNVRGVRNTPCETVPGRRAPTVEMCESGETYVPLNDGTSWLGDPNSTMTGQSIPQVPGDVNTPAASVTPSSYAGDAAAPQIATAEYDPDTGTYIGPDGRAYTQTNLAVNTEKEQTWQTLMQPTA